MTSIEWLFESLWDAPKDKFTWESIRKKAEKMHKQEIMDAWKDGYGGDEHDENEYYNNTFKKD